MIGVVILLTSLPLMTKGIEDGDDLSFHLMRIAGIAREMRYGNVPARISSFFMDGAGYPASVYYGDLLLYIPAGLCLFGFPVVTAYKLYIVMINVGTTIISYLCMKNIFKDSKTALLTCLAYCTVPYRLVCIYVRAAVGEYSAIMFMPLIMLAMYRMYVDDTVENEGGIKENVLILSVGMSGLVGTHILSVEMVVLTLMLICVLFFKKTFKKKILKTYLLAVAGTCLLSAYFIVPFLDYYINVPVKINEAVQNKEMLIQYAGARFSEYFSFFKDVNHVGQRMFVSPGMTLLLVVFIAAFWIINKRADRNIVFLTGGSIFFMFVASDVFPWDHLVINTCFGNLLAQVQFPWRFIGIAVAFMVLLMGNILVRTKEETVNYFHIMGGTFGGICVVMACFFVSSYNDDAQIVTYYDKWELYTYSVGSGEYLRQGSNSRMVTKEIGQENMDEVTLLFREGCKTELYCDASEMGGSVILPVYNYKGYYVMDEGGKEYEIIDSDNNFIQFFLPENFVGNITVDFAEPWYWRLAEMISVLSLLSLCIVLASHIYQYDTIKTLYRA